MPRHPVASPPTSAAVEALDPSRVARLRRAVRGTVLAPDDDGYEEARRVWNGMIDRRPALIVQPADTDDIARAVALAREHGLALAVRGGGHNVAGNAVCDDGLVIDLRSMKAIRVDPSARTVRAQGGATWGEFDRATQQFGLATTGGAISTTGIAGLTLGGGIGWLARAYGLACDNLVSVDLVTADGALRRVSGRENPELFWGLRGGGGNFGVAAALEYRLHPVGPVLGGLLIHPFTAGRELFRFYRDFTAAAPPELTCYFVLTSSPEGAPVAAVAACYHGDHREGERLLAPLRGFGSPLADGIAAVPYVALQTMLDAAYPSGLLNYWKSGFLPSLPDEAIDVMLAHAAERPSPLSHMAIEHLGGAIARVGANETAFAHRDRPYNFLCLGMTADPYGAEACVAWARRFWDAMQPFAPGAVYVNYLGVETEEGRERVEAAYGAAKYRRLAHLKAAYDPDNLFRVNQNIRPAS